MVFNLRDPSFDRRIRKPLLSTPTLIPTRFTLVNDVERQPISNSTGRGASHTSSFAAEFD